MNSKTFEQSKKNSFSFLKLNSNANHNARKNSYSFKQDNFKNIKNQIHYNNINITNNYGMVQKDSTEEFEKNNSFKEPEP